MSKRGGHGSNYLGTPWTMSRHLKVPLALMENFQAAYFDAFPCIPRWHQWVAQQLQQHGRLVTAFGRERQFFGRPDDDATLRKAIAFSPQGNTGDRLNLGLWRIWKHMKQVELLAQVHDAVYFQYRAGSVEEENEIVSTALALVRVALSNGSRDFTIPGSAVIGWNWGKWDAAENPDGLAKWSAERPDTRSRQPGGRERILG